MEMVFQFEKYILNNYSPVETGKISEFIFKMKKYFHN